MNIFDELYDAWCSLSTKARALIFFFLSGK